jgi:hypothetical protein
MKHSRLLTCYSALRYLLATYSEKKSVQPDDAVNMAALSPTARLEWLLEQTSAADAHDKIRELVQHYERFLSDTGFSEEKLIERFLDPKKSKEYTQSANKLGDLMFEAIELVGQRNAFHRV